ncbi:uncharacterized protein TRAVEDRAFT_60953 [Trametes versicolor FP-101664 SS1]|uniref:uncharacterized protein n=1 Tax=Trametes versicolor (strain FP-101664) TaxID=717944 RepID=UPI00046228C9|nr:uncharacterized protein TRAVEDRAFT_60953 [Trametes versicolor FP-101664 SS1]EIW53643.1 hypothetical protein TRAVEDRAFT_60953 [Trametes versicolor FP-101664 SS1]
MRKPLLLESPVSQYAALRDETAQDEPEGRVAFASAPANCADPAQLTRLYGDHAVYTDDVAHASTCQSHP